MAEEDVITIRNNYKSNGNDATMQSIADEYGVAQSLISDIINYKKWVHL